MNASEPTRVLVVDDDEMVLVIVRKLLEAESFTVDVTPSAQEALQRLPANNYNAIICDMWMPGMTGKDFYYRVKRDFPGYESRILLLTGDIASEATWDFVDQRRLPYVLKPVNAQELRRKIGEIIGERPDARSAKKGAEARRHRRLAMKGNVRIRRKKWDTGPEIAPITNASKEGVYFLSDREHRVGLDVLVSFPYTGGNDVEVEGCIVRVDERSDKRRGVAVAIGEGAVKFRASQAGSFEDRKRQEILAMADMAAAARPTIAGAGRAARPEEGAAELRLRLDQERDEARRLALELADLKTAYERVTGERDRMAAEEGEREQKLRELRSARAAMNAVTGELHGQIETLRAQLEAAAAARELAEQELATYRKMEEARALRAAETRGASSKSAEVRASESSGEAEQEAQRLREELSDLRERIKDFQTRGVGPLTILSAYCDMLGAVKGLDENTQKTLIEISQQAALLRAAFQKFAKKQ